MNSEKRIARGLCLLSGGLDSQLAVCVLRDQGIYVEGMVFDSPFLRSLLHSRLLDSWGSSVMFIRLPLRFLNSSTNRNMALAER